MPQMVAGSPTRGIYNASSFADQAVTFVCLGMLRFILGLELLWPDEIA